MATLMWEARPAVGRLAELVAWVSEHADPGADIYQSDGPDPRVVLIDDSGRGLPAVSPDLVARPPHAWSFDRVAAD